MTALKNSDGKWDKKIKLSLSGKAKKPLKNVDVNKFSGKRSVVIEKSNSKLVKRGSSFVPKKPLFDTKFKTNTSDFEKRKLAEQRATKRLKDESSLRDKKPKIGIKKRAEIISKNLSFLKKADVYYRLNRLIDERQMGNLFKVMMIKNRNNKFSLGF